MVVSAGKSYVFSDQHPGNGYLTRQEAQQVISKLPQARADDAARQKADQAEAQARALAQLSVQQARTKAAIYANNLSAANLNARLCSVLTTATDAPQPMSPESWYTWWDDYNEVTSQGDKPMIVTYQFNAVPTVSVATTPTVTRCSCLVAGTPVWTESGPVPVEQLRLGDRVLACDSDSGRLALKPVLKTIVNPGRTIFSLHTRTKRWR